MDSELNLDCVQKHFTKNHIPYTVESVLGTGSFGTAVRARHENLKEVVAIKFIQACKMHEYLCSEVRNHKILRHPHVIRFKRALEVGGHLAIFMEYANGSNLFHAVKSNRRLSEPLARWIFQQLILAVDYCHRKGVASRDIKCENVLLVKGHKLPIVKLSDFGYSHSTSIQGRPAKYEALPFSETDGNCRSIVGSLDYMAPEVIGNSKNVSYDGYKADIWSCGVVLYVMVTGQYPFSKKNSSKTNPKEREGLIKRIFELDFICPGYLSQELVDLIHKMITNPERRFSLKEVMSHSWFLRNFPTEAATMNDELLEEEQKIEVFQKARLEKQTDDEVEREISKASWYDKMKRPKPIITDGTIEDEFEADLLRHPSI